MANAPMDRGTPPPAHSDIVVPAVLLLPYVSFFGLVERCHKGVGLVILKATEGPWLKKGQANNILKHPTVPTTSSRFHQLEVRSQATHGNGFEGHFGDPGVLRSLLIQKRYPIICRASPFSWVFVGQETM